MREYKLHKLRLMILARLLYGKKLELVIDGTIEDIANVIRARTQKIRRERGKVWWAKRRRKIVRRVNGKVVEFKGTKIVIQTGGVERVVIDLPRQNLALEFFNELLLHIERVYL